MLSPAQFAELIAVIQTIQEEGPRSEVRRAPRIEHLCSIRLALGSTPDAEPVYMVQMKDISARGIRFTHATELVPGTEFVVRLQAPEGQTATVLTRVVHCGRVGDNTWQIGAEFISSLDQVEPIHIEPSFEDLMQTRSPVHH